MNFLTTRKVLWVMVFLGSTVNYMIRVNLNLAIVSMIKIKSTIKNRNITSECISNSFENQTNKFTVGEYNSTKFDWDENQQGKILGSFFWLHWLSQLPGGILAMRYGTKKVYGFSQFFGVLCCFLIPTAAYSGTTYLLILRVVQGFCFGFAWPSMHSLASKWIPPDERSSFVAAYMGNSFGIALTYAICGFIIAKWSWEPVFYVCGILGLMWCLLWWILIYDNPADHPRISEEEKQYIIASLQKTVSITYKTHVPWKKILSSKQLWILTLSQFGNFWGLTVLLTYAPIYFQFVHGWNIQSTGLLSGFPHISRVIWSFLFSQFVDYLLRRNKMSTTNVRKLATLFSNIIHGVFMVVLAYSGCDWIMAVIFLTISVSVQGSVSSGTIAGIVDISPNYASIIFGMVNSFVITNGFIIPFVVSYFLKDGQTTTQWQKVFWLAAIVAFVTGLMDILFLKSIVKSWNSPPAKETTNNLPETELMVLKSNEAKNKNDHNNVSI